MQEHRYTVLFEPVPEGGYNVIVPALPEICTCGDTLEEAREMSLDAIRCVLESMLEDNEYTPAQRKIIDAELADARKGPYYGPFDTAEEMIAHMKGQLSKRAAARKINSSRAQ